MRWKYYRISFENNIYTYEYARENAESRGIIKFDISNQRGEVIKPCSLDENFSTDAALEHFYSVIDAGFPKEYAVSCG